MNSRNVEWTLFPSFEADLSKLVKKRSLESKPDAAFSVSDAGGLVIDEPCRSLGEGQLRPSDKWNASSDRAQLGRADCCFNSASDLPRCARSKVAFHFLLGRSDPSSKEGLESQSCTTSLQLVDRSHSERDFRH